MSDAERRRLLYVACTRAVDHLVVSLHRVPPKDGDAATNRLPSGALLAAGGAADPEGRAPAPLAPNPGGFSVERPAPATLEWADRAAWATERDRALRTRRPARHRQRHPPGRRPRPLWSDPGERDDEGLRKEPVDLELPPVAARPLRHRDRPSRARHAPVLRSRHRRRHPGARRGPVRGRGHHRPRGHGRVARPLGALRAPIVQAAAVTEHHRELFVAAMVGDRVLEGYVDLLVRTPDGYVIVDYKTDAWRTGADAPSGSPATAANSPRTASPSNGSSANRSSAACSCTAAPPARPRRSRSTDGPTPSPSCARDAG